MWYLQCVVYKYLKAILIAKSTFTFNMSNYNNFYQRETNEPSFAEVADFFLFLVGLCAVSALIGSTYQHKQDEVKRPRADIYACKDPGREILSQQVNPIIRVVNKFLDEPDIDSSVDPKHVVCTVQNGGRISFHLEKSSEKIVDIALEYEEHD